MTANDNDVPGVTVSRTALEVHEGGSGSWTVVLNTRPASNVVIAVAQAAGSSPDVTVDTDTATAGLESEMTFTPANWNVAQTVMAGTAHDEDAVDDAATYTHTVVAASSDDAYDAVTIPDVAVTVNDDETAALFLNPEPPAALAVPEDGSAIWSVALTSRPTAEVTVTLSLSGSDDVTADTDAGTAGDQHTLTFAPDAWSRAQVVTVRAADDADAAADRATIALAASGGDYEGVSAALAVSVVENDAPAVTGIVFNSDPAAGDTYRKGETVIVYVNFSDAVAVTGTPRLALDVDVRCPTHQCAPAPRHATYQSTLTFGSPSLDHRALRFDYEVQGGDFDTDGIAFPADALELNGGTIRSRTDDEATAVDAVLGSAAAGPFGGHKAVGGPGVLDVGINSFPADGEAHRTGETVLAMVIFSEAVTVTGTPRLALDIGGQTRHAAFTGALRGVGGLEDDTVLRFEYVVAADDRDEDGIAFPANALGLNGGAIRGKTEGGAADLSSAARGPLGEHRVNSEGVAPAVAGPPVVTEPGSGGTYAAGERIEARVRFTAPVTVDTAEGSPTLGLALGGVRREAAYEGGSGTAELTFALTVPEAAAGAGVAKAVANGIRLQGATIRGADGTDAALAFGAAPGVTAVEIAGAGRRRLGCGRCGGGDAGVRRAGDDRHFRGHPLGGAGGPGRRRAPRALHERLGHRPARLRIHAGCGRRHGLRRDGRAGQPGAQWRAHRQHGRARRSALACGRELRGRAAHAAAGALGGGCARYGRRDARLRGDARAGGAGAGDGGLGHRRRHGDGGRGLHRRLGHAHLRAGRDEEDHRGGGDGRRGRGGAGDADACALERRGRDHRGGEGHGHGERPRRGAAYRVVLRRAARA